jgi:hypothetical protein
MSYAKAQSKFNNEMRDIYITSVLQFDFQAFYFVDILDQCTNFMATSKCTVLFVYKY